MVICNLVKLMYLSFAHNAWRQSVDIKSVFKLVFCNLSIEILSSIITDLLVLVMILKYPKRAKYNKELWCSCTSIRFMLSFWMLVLYCICLRNLVLSWSVFIRLRFYSPMGNFRLFWVPIETNLYEQKFQTSKIKIFLRIKHILK